MKEQLNEAHDSTFSNPQLLEVRKINDLLRTANLTAHGRIFLTKEVSCSEFRDDIIKAVREFNDFNIDNDPYGEHDSAIVNVFKSSKEQLCKARFKIDYYDKNYEFGVDPMTEDCNRVLTIMFTHEI